MFFDWLNIFSETSIMDEMRDRYTSMIANAHWMYQTMGSTMIENGDPSQYAEEMEIRRKQLTEAEHRIRRMVIEHLAINPAKDLGLCLIFFSGVREVERLGEVSMDLQHVAVAHQPYPEQVVPKLESVFRTVESHFEAVGNCFSSWDKEAAQKIIDALTLVQEECDAVLDDIMMTQDQPVCGSVAAALTMRYFKQVAQLISNIASSVVNPVHEMDS